MKWERRYLNNQASKEEDAQLASLVRAVLDNTRLVQLVMALFFLLSVHILGLREICSGCLSASAVPMNDILCL